MAGSPEVQQEPSCAMAGEGKPALRFGRCKAPMILREVRKRP